MENTLLCAEMYQNPQNFTRTRTKGLEETRSKIDGINGKLEEVNAN